MPSPFPGMNPYLEHFWHDFHGRFCTVAAETLTAQVRPHFIVRLEENIYIRELPADPRRQGGRADLALARTAEASGSQATMRVLEAPAQVRLPVVEIERQAYLTIRDRHDHQIKTVLELLSPANKRSGLDRDQYLAKRDQLFTRDVHFVEVDLLRGGTQLPLDGAPECNYYVLVSRVEDRPDAGIWPLRLPDPLPNVPIPLPAPHPGAQLDLQGILHRIYDAAGYEDDIYRYAPQPKLGPEEDAWARRFVPQGTG